MCVYVSLHGCMPICAYVHAHASSKCTQGQTCMHLLLPNPCPTRGVHSSIFNGHGYAVVIMLDQYCHGDIVAILSVRTWTNEGLCIESRKVAEGSLICRELKVIGFVLTYVN